MTIEDQAYACNVCGSTEFIDFLGRIKAMCGSCGSVERTRALKIVLDSQRLVRPGMRVMHLAPELGIGRHIRSIIGDGYDAFDIDPTRYSKELKVSKLDLVRDVETMPSKQYDLVLHSHVMEHLLCNETAILYHLHRLVTSSGHHVFCVPIHPGYYEADLSELTPKERERRFFQGDHVRRFGKQDFHLTIGKIFDLKTNDLEQAVGADALRRYRIPELAWRGMSSHTFFVLRKDDLKLKP
jgi:phosphoglycolate phosphatase